MRDHAPCLTRYIFMRGHGLAHEREPRAAPTALPTAFSMAASKKPRRKKNNNRSDLFQKNNACPVPSTRLCTHLTSGAPAPVAQG